MKNKILGLLIGMLSLTGCVGRVYMVDGIKGDQGDPGLPGDSGKDGLNGYERFLQEHPSYPGDEKEWLEDLAAGLLDVENDDDINQYAEITGGGAAFLRASSDCTELDIREYYRGNPVLSIASYAAYDTEIIERVSVSKYVREIGAYAFAVNYRLKQLDLPDSISKLGERCFNGTGLESFSCPASLRAIPRGCFMYSYDLKEVTITDQIEEIGERAFDGNSLTSVFIPASVKTIGMYAFSNFNGGPVTIYCEAPSKPSSWASNWAVISGSSKIIWGATRP